jgi:hypothetical protein
MSNSLNLTEIDQEQALHLSKFFIRSNQNLFLFGRRGVGKMIDLETELPTPSGFIKLKNLKEGDELFDEQGNICHVVKLHPIDYRPESYKITFDDGSIINACADHLWLTWDKKSRKSHHRANNPTIHPQIRTTKEILETLRTNTSKKETNHSIPCAQSVKYPEQKLPIDPYVLGCWLGDGNSHSGHIECADKEILDEIVKRGYDIHLVKSSVRSKSKSCQYRIGGVAESYKDEYGLPHTTYLLSKQLKELNLFKNKHIPDIYLCSSYEQRLALLQGLMDTDGCCLKTGLIEYCTVLPNLALQIQELISSLGIKSTLHCNESWLYDKRCQNRFRIKVITKLPIFKLERKIKNLKKSNNQCTRNTHRYIVNIESISPVPMRCITVDSFSNLFLVTRSFIATHNTHIAMQAAEECGYNVNYINLSVIERPDLAGYPNMNSPGDIITFKSPSFLPKLLDSNKPDSIILFDEVDKAPVEVTAPLLEILQFKSINGNAINVAGCILTGNLSNEGAYSNLISTALLDRGAKYILSFNFEKWIDWAKLNNVHDLILGFLRSNPEFACGDIEDTCYASPSPRSWTLASEALNRARELKIVDIESVTQIISGFVGGEAGLRFKIWYEHYRRFEPYIHSLIESGIMTFDFNALAPTEKVVFVVSACYYSKQRVLAESGKSKNKFAYLENLCKFFTHYQVDNEVQVMGLYNSFDFVFISKHKLYACKEFFDLFTRINEHISIKK